MSHSLSSSETTSSLKISSTLSSCHNATNQSNSELNINENNNNNNDRNHNNDNGNSDNLVQSITPTSISNTSIGPIININNNNNNISLVQECSAIKKGLLWEQQQNRFFFNRWKEKFYILTTDYLTCFKKGSKKVGMSEMGSFVYKINLNEIKTLTWVDKKKNGVIGVQLSNSVIFLWNNSEKILDEWMISLQESTSRTKGRREALRKSATLLPTSLQLMMKMSTSSTTTASIISGSSSPSHHHLIKDFTDHHFIERNNSPSMFGHQQLQHGNSNHHNYHRSNTPSDHDFIADIIPPPPPPRRYLRCLSSDFDSISSSLEERKLLTTGPTRTKTSLESKRFLMPAVSNTFHKLNSGDYYHAGQHQSHYDGRKPLSSHNSGSNGTGNGHVSQSLRCKSSYALQLSPLLLTNSPTLFQQQQQRRSTAKRLSTASQESPSQPQLPPPLPSHQSQQRQLPQRPQSQTVFRCDSLQSADSEFSFISTKSIPIQADSFNRVNHSQNSQRQALRGTPPPPSRSNHSNHQRSQLSNSASLVLNHQLRRKPLSTDSYRPPSQFNGSTFNGVQNSRQTPPPPPPPIPPHRTHLHHF